MSFLKLRVTRATRAFYTGEKHGRQTRTAPVHKTGRVRGGLSQTARAEIVCYLDDLLLAAESRDLLSRQLHFLLQTVQALGFLINWEKSELAPTRHPTFLGAAIDRPRQLARPSPDRVNTIMAAASRRRQASARVWLQFLGYLARLVVVLPDCRLHMRPLQIHLLRHYSPSRDLLTRLVPISPTIRLHLV